MTSQEWHDLVKGMLRAEMVRRAITYDQLSALLAEMGIKEEPKSLRNKVARGGFAAVFFVQCLKAMGCKNLTLEE